MRGTLGYCRKGTFDLFNGFGLPSDVGRASRFRVSSHGGFGCSYMLEVRQFFHDTPKWHPCSQAHQGFMQTQGQRSWQQSQFFIEGKKSCATLWTSRITAREFKALVMLSHKGAGLGAWCDEQDATLGTPRPLGFVHVGKSALGLVRAVSCSIWDRGRANCTSSSVSISLSVERCARMLTPPFLHRVHDFMAHGLPARFKFIQGGHRHDLSDRRDAQYYPKSPSLSSTQKFDAHPGERAANIPAQTDSGYTDSVDPAALKQTDA